MLYDKSVAFAGAEHTQRFWVMYRNKPKEYWDNIHFNRRGVMEKYEKVSMGPSCAEGELRGSLH